MCGIYGVVTFGAPPPSVAALDHMASLLAHRGPDGHGRRCDGFAVLGATRLSIVDPGPQSNQPLTDPTGQVWLVCNGEIYNAAELRSRFPDYPFRSRSDLEPILPLFLARGAGGLEDLNGMFALAIWDARTSRLILARDRAGEKPLFTMKRQDGVAFASELQALLALPGASREPDARAAHDFLTLGYIREPLTPFRAIRRIAAGTTRVVQSTGASSRRYWRPEEIAQQGWKPHQARHALDTTLRGAVARHLQSDVPVGAFISGGVDSALIAALAVSSGARDLHLFSVGFESPSFDETRWANAVATELGLPLTTVRLGEEELYEALNAITRTVAEPVGDPAALPTWHLAGRARTAVGVVLSGEGADELFGGYPTYLGHTLAPWWQRLPRPVRRATRWGIERLPSSSANHALEFLLKRFVASAELQTVERHLQWLTTGMTDPPIVAGDDPMLLDYRMSLRESLLVKIDRATMLHSLESRAPYLDRAVTELALSLPPSMKVRHLTTKWLLKQVARRYLPRRIVSRRKRGLSVPIAKWINHGLRREVDRLLTPDRVAAYSSVNPRRVARCVAEHRAGQANHARALWPLIVWGMWKERWT